MNEKIFEHMTESEKNTCSFCRDYNIGDCRTCDLFLRTLQSMGEEQTSEVRCTERSSVQQRPKGATRSQKHKK